MSARRDRLLRRRWSVEDDDLIMAWCGIPDADLAARLGRTPGAIQSRRQKLRRMTSRERQPWRPEEDEHLRRWVGRETAEAIAHALGRSVRAVQGQAAELGLSWKCPAGEDLLTATAIAAALGIPCAKTIAWWIETGYLAGTRAPSASARGYRPVWRVARDDLRAFLAGYPWLWDRERVADPEWADYVATLPAVTFVGVGEAARRLGYTPEGVNLLIRRGYLAAEKRGPNWCIREEDVATFVRPPRGAAARRVKTIKLGNLGTRRTEGYRTKPETLARQVEGRANGRAARLLADPVALAVQVGLEESDIAYWLPRLPDCAPARRVAKLRDLAALFEEQRPAVRRIPSGGRTGRAHGDFGVVVPLRGDGG